MNNPYTLPETGRSIALVLCNGVSDFRITLAARELKRAGYDISVMSNVPYYSIMLHDLFIICRPGDSMCDLVRVCLESGKPVVIDMDDDFNSIPTSNPAYPFVGPGAGSGDYLRKLNLMIREATAFTAASPSLSERYKRGAVVIPNCWDEENTHWGAGKLRMRGWKESDMVIGWSGTSTHREDFNLCAAAVHRMIETYPDVHVMIGADPEIYSLFDDVPESRKMFIPGMSYQEYPSMLRYMDVSLAPLVDNVFNRAKSNIKLLEAGAMGIPWVASALPQYTDWQDGGQIVSSRIPHGDFYDKLVLLHDDPKWRYSLGKQGHDKALQFTATETGKLWLELVRDILT